MAKNKEKSGGGFILRRPACFQARARFLLTIEKYLYALECKGGITDKHWVKAEFTDMH